MHYSKTAKRKAMGKSLKGAIPYDVPAFSYDPKVFKFVQNNPNCTMRDITYGLDLSQSTANGCSTRLSVKKEKKMGNLGREVNCYWVAA